MHIALEKCACNDRTSVVRVIIVQSNGDGIFSPVAPSYTNNIYYSTGGTPIKWDKHEEDMKNLSKKYPDIEFKLEGIEIDTYIVWLKYFLDGE